MRDSKVQTKNIEETLKALSELRIKENGWIDSEKESQEESCAYKNMEIIYSFFLSNHIYPTDFARIDIPENILIDDINSIIEAIKRDGFHPSPHLYIREKTDFVDFAALSIQFFILSNKYLRNLKKMGDEKKSILKDSEEIIKKAIKFLKNSPKRDKYGIRWAGSKTKTIRGTSYCNVYFTAQVLSSFAFLLSNYRKYITNEEYEEIEQIIKEGCLWIVKQERDGLIAGDETKSKLEINFTIFGLNSLFDCITFCEQEIQLKALKLFISFVNHLKENKNNLSWLSFIDVPIAELNKPIYYDDRSSIGNIITTLCKGKEVFKEDKIIDDVFYLINFYVGELLRLRDVSKKLWDSGNFLMYLNSRAIEALLYSTKYGKPIEYMINEREALIALQKTLANPLVQRLFLNELTNIELLKKFKPEGKIHEN